MMVTWFSLTLCVQKSPEEAKQEVEISRQKAVEFFKRGCMSGNGEVRMMWAFCKSHKRRPAILYGSMNSRSLLP